MNIKCLGQCVGHNIAKQTLYSIIIIIILLTLSCTINEVGTGQIKNNKICIN